MVFLGHPGPSMLVTAVFVALAGLAGRAVPDAFRIAMLVGIMLPIQLCIGVVNDVVDLPEDALAKPYKPLVAGTVSRSSAALVGVALGVLGLAVAATVNLATLVLGGAALAAGLAYDLGLRRTVLSWVPWWGGMAVLPLTAYATAGAIPSRLFVLVPLAALVALGLHFANALPDIEADRAAGVHSLPVVIGRIAAGRSGPVALALAGVIAWVAAVPFGQAGFVLLAGTIALCVGIALVLATRAPRPFPILAVATAVFAVAWLASLPVA